MKLGSRESTFSNPLTTSSLSFSLSTAPVRVFVCSGLSLLLLFLSFVELRDDNRASLRPKSRNELFAVIRPFELIGLRSRTDRVISPFSKEYQIFCANIAMILLM